MGSRRVRNPRITALPCDSISQSQGISDWISFQVSFWPSNLRVLLGGALIAEPGWMLARRILGSGGTSLCGVSFWPFLNSSSWWWLVSSVLLPW